MSNKIKRELENIDIPTELQDRARLGVNKAKGEMDRDSFHFIKNKWVVTSSAIVLGFFLLIGSAFISPTMSEILAKVPFLNLIQSESIVKIVSDELKEQGYQVQGVSDSAYPDKIIYVSIDGTDQYYDDVKDQVKDKTEEILGESNYDAFSVEIEKFKEHRNIEPNLDEKSKQYMEETEVLMEAISERLDAEGFEITTFGVTHNQFDHYVQLDIPDNEPRNGELKQLIEEVIGQHDFGDFEVKLNKYNEERRDLEMAVSSKVIGPLHEALRAREEFHTKGMAYSFHPAPLQIIVKTTVKSTDKDAKEFAADLETTVEKFLATEEIKKVMKDEPYKIIIRSSNQKKLNK
ncbi:DUF4030 domain-containing protein [Aquibacillus saliphilus]|uniref:DUF4030 domain-containing protein n=1 Tax=Aquibacillus saliphilus TaxID=1909422 RepID=UPI001CEFCAA6|nr:DUF4030 domain-containing protein [Aquibacillus saliphilus]